MARQYYRQDYEPEITEWVTNYEDREARVKPSQRQTPSYQLASRLHISPQKARAFLAGTSGISGTQSRTLRYFLRAQTQIHTYTYTMEAVVAYVRRQFKFPLSYENLLTAATNHHLAYARRSLTHPFFIWFDTSGQRTYRVSYVVYPQTDITDQTVYFTANFLINPDELWKLTSVGLNDMESSDTRYLRDDLYGSLVF